MPRSSPRAVVADDSHFMRSVISDILSEGGIDVVAQAKNGHEAVQAVREHDPDVVTMDVEMPEMDGIEAVGRIMAQHPTPILMLSAHTDEDADVTFEALQKGAVDFFTKPGGEVSMEMSRLKDQLVDIVHSVAQAEPRAGDTAAETTSSGAGTERPDAAPERYGGRPTLVIGSSTGGPTVVEEVMSSLPLTASLRVLIVQHMPGGFTGRFAERLDARSEYDVSEAQDGARIGSGEALVAAGDQHMEVANYSHGRLRVSLTDDPPVNSVRPAVDVTMKSAAETVDDRLIGVILTGMGEDGADGIRALKERGARTIAQDEASSAVFGMPKRAIETGCVDTITSIESIPAAILDAVPQEVH
ncbi:protein-glutamate methylesterase/protein-glutamine glutaminase [Halapricum hydrolyticum]|uniref:Protein-glutamate methylesterase/protein-glutamine glutaminase n=1 Tax=Halapricum hydrolyticum TaxID=2979991 RepID=A0AAE3LGU1_9EURY|nr:chemotaxis response regulator protein-glutamate methylesterase [Halapricum hydrolyticum]MCU4717132.1 chemotaxis response regulator protein-glutamate methylesterase [Halapricum hydrolyticum]MCU4726059.1 chemotaxis response regulator protein-glutamate methylesterase [Halapricum hydrolyticum]